MNFYFLIIFGLLTIANVNNAWNVKGGQSQAPRPFWQNTGRTNRNYQQQPVPFQQDEASAEATPQIPQTSFTCSNKPFIPGMYADIETDCRVYHVCVEDKKESFFCGEGTVFNQKLLTCDYPKDTDCAASQNYWSANEELGKPGAEPGPGGNQIRPVAPSKTRQFQPQFQGGFRPSTGPIQQQPIKQYQPQQPVQQYQPQKPIQQYQPQQPVQQYQPQKSIQQQPIKQYEDNGFVNEPVKKLRPTYKVVKTPQQTVQYQPNPSSSPKIYLSPSKSKITQEAIPLPDGPINYQQEAYQQSETYFPQQPVKQYQQPIQQQQQPQQPVKQYRPQQQIQQIHQSRKSSSQHYYSQQSVRQTSKQQYYNQQQTNSPNSWRPANKPGGGLSYNEITEQKIDLNIPKTNFVCEGKPYEPGMYADMEAGCSIYHVCFDGRQETFACGGGTVFSQKLLTCDYQDKVDCQNTPRYYSSNENLVREQGNWVFKQQPNQQRSYPNNDYGQRKIK